MEEDFTQDIRMLPSPDVFRDRTTKSARELADEMKQALLKRLDTSDTGKVEVLQGTMVGEYQKEYMRHLRQWADVGGYEIRFYGYVDRRIIERVRIQPKGTQWPTVPYDWRALWARFCLFVARPLYVVVTLVVSVAFGVLWHPTIAFFATLISAPLGIGVFAPIEFHKDKLRETHENWKRRKTELR